MILFKYIKYAANYTSLFQSKGNYFTKPIARIRNLCNSDSADLQSVLTKKERPDFSERSNHISNYF